MWLFISCWLARGANMYSANHFYNLLQINFFPKNFFLQKFCNFGFDDVQWTTFVFDDCVGSFCTTFASVANILKAKKKKNLPIVPREGSTMKRYGIKSSCNEKLHRSYDDVFKMVYPNWFFFGGGGAWMKCNSRTWALLIFP